MKIWLTDLKATNRWLWLACIMVLSLIGLLFAFGFDSKATAASNKIKITFWHSMNGANGKKINKLVAKYNHSQNKYEIVPIYQGAYGLAMSKFYNTTNTHVSPALIQVDNADTNQMVAANNYVPIEKFIQQDGYDKTSLNAGVLNAYSVNKQLQAMPFNSSVPVLYYNRTMLQKLGIPALPKNPTYSQITTTAKAITAKSHGKVKGLTLQNYGWLYEELLINQNANLVNHNNGRTGMATKVNLTSPASYRIMNWLRSNIKAGNFQNYGTGSAASANQMTGFLAQKLGIFMQSSATLGGINKNAKFKLGVAYMPHPDHQKSNGVAIGGAGLWITKGKSNQEQQGAWNFIKYLSTPKVQADWQVATGYMAVHQAAVKEPSLKKAIKKDPMLAVPFDELQHSQANYATQGPFFANFSDERGAIQVALQQVYSGKPIKKALTEAEQRTNLAIDEMNQANGRYLDFAR